MEGIASPFRLSFFSSTRHESRSEGGVEEKWRSQRQNRNVFLSFIFDEAPTTKKALIEKIDYEMAEKMKSKRSVMPGKMNKKSRKYTS